MDSIAFTASGREWKLTKAPQFVAFMPTELCSANPDIIHGEGRSIVVGNKVWYTPTRIDDETGAIVCEMTRDERDDW